MKKYFALTSAVSALLVSGSLIAAPTSSVVKDDAYASAPTSVGVVTETTTHTMASDVHSASDVQTDAAPSGKKSKSASKLLSQ